MAPAQSSIGTLHYIEQTVYKAEKALIAAKFNGLLINKKTFDAQKDAKKPDFLAKNPTGKVPFLETDMGCVFTSNAIARYVARCRADTSLYGKCFDDESHIDTWMEFCTHELEVPLMTWVYPVLGLMEDIPKATSDAQADVKKALTTMETQLKSTEYLIGDFITLADIALVCALREGFARVFDSAFRKPYPKVVAWFERCCGMPQFQAVLGSVKLCATAENPKPVIAAFAPPARGEGKKEGKKDAAPKDAAPKAQPKAQPKAKAEVCGKAPAPARASAPSGEVEAKIQAVGDQIRILKEKLKSEGLSGKKINDHEEVKKLVAQLQELKSQAPAAGAAPAAAAAPAAPAAVANGAAGGGDVEAQITAVGDEIRALKEKLKGEGLSGKKINDHAEVKRLVTKLQDLKAQAPAGGSAPAAVAAPAPAAAAAPAAGGDLEAQIKSVGDEIRMLKEKLKGEGLSGKKINDHADVKRLVAQLQELKAKA